MWNHLRKTLKILKTLENLLTSSFPLVFSRRFKPFLNGVMHLDVSLKIFKIEKDSLEVF